jgi:hypothetical protein
MLIVPGALDDQADEVSEACQSGPVGFSTQTFVLLAKE